MLSEPQNRILEYLKDTGGVDVPTYEVGIRIYGKFFNSYKGQLKAAQKTLEELHRLDLVVKNYSYTHNCDVWTLKDNNN